ncbi:MFS transporter [Kitasatospora viridis]|uniref:Putative MFS family arabinose efflux permease n=1 Tax=Kitasatospora viridis TaxID=281105 RepID=A0A561S9V0_9ACTN|nr:MFS transporter [Kitasatospora viridis]TWF71585.1 putative MFS family arabinose efflux permease [Kitasatospora viridis]
MTDRPTGEPAAGRAGYLAAAAAFAVCMAGTTLPTPLYGLYQDQIGFSELTVTVVFAIYAFGVIGVLLLVGNASDTVGRRPVLLCGLAFAAASAVTFLAEQGLRGLPLLFLGRLLSGLSAGLFTGTATAYVLELAPPGRRARAGFVATAANMGGLGCGPLLSGVLAQYAPGPLVLPYVVHLALLAASFAVTWFLPETVPAARPLRSARPRRPTLAPEVRGVFVPAAVAAFAGFSLLGVFTSVSPTFVTKDLGIHNHAIVGLVVFAAFSASTLGQLLVPRLGTARAVPLGCLVLICGLGLLAVSLATATLAPLVLSAVVGGAGQGLGLRGAVGEIAAAAPAEHRGGALSALFVVAYFGISIPVIGVGLLSGPLGLAHAGLVFTACMGVLAAVSGGYLLRRARA